MIDVQIMVGSKSDLPKVEEAKDLFEKFEIKYNLEVASAHRTPDFVREVVASAERNGVKVYIAGAGMAAHLAGTVAGLTTRPVIGIPFSASTVNGLDSLLSTVQMPPGIPVATVAIDGAFNAAMLAAEIIAVTDNTVRQRIIDFRESKAREILVGKV